MTGTCLSAQRDGMFHDCVLMEQLVHRQQSKNEHDVSRQTPKILMEGDVGSL